MLKKQKNLKNLRKTTDVAGKYLVAAELSMRGWTTTLVPKNSPNNIDVIAITSGKRRTINIRVKTRSVENKQGWFLSKDFNTFLPDNNSYFVFVDLKKEDEQPDYFIIPRNLFARWIIECNQKPSFEVFEKYHNNWDI
jgi:hypothetical protein